MVSQIAEAPNQKKGNSLDNLAYDNLKKLCPDIAKLKEGEFLILKTKSKTALDVSIGCKHPEKGEFSGIYEIYSIHQDTKVFTTVDISHKNKTAFAIIYETKKDEQTKITDAKDVKPERFQDLLKDLTLKGYKQTNTQSTDRLR